MKKIGFIGTGVMGTGMIRNLLKAGYEVSVYNRTRAKAEPLLAEGCRWCASSADCAKQQDAVITIVGHPKDVEEVYFGETGVFAGVTPGTVLIDMTTTCPGLAVRIAEEAPKHGCTALDAPVSGGDTGAKNGTLTVMVGGEEAVFRRCLPLFEAMGKNIILEGGAGAGQHTKMANQIAIAANLAGTCEAIAYARAAGLDPEKMLATISTGAAGSWQMTYNGEKILRDDMTPGFFTEHFIKDMRLAAEFAEYSGLSLPVLEQVLTAFRSLEGREREGTQTLIHYYEK